MLKIKVINAHEPNSAQEVVFEAGSSGLSEFLIGRLPTCGLVLNSQEVSRLHARISFTEGNYTFADLASRSGSWLNYVELRANQKHPLQVGDLIRIADHLLEVIEMTPPQPTAVTQVKPTREPPEIQPPPEQPAYWQKGPLNLCCVRVTPETPEVKTFTFVAEPAKLFVYKPGQFITVDLEIDGQEVSRSYSISSSPSRPQTLEITVKRVPASEPTHLELAVPPGLVSNWLHDNLSVGSHLQVNGPFGQFTCVDHPATRLLFISAGSGITPMMAMSRWIYDTAGNQDVIFLHSARSVDDLIFHQELLLLARQPNFKLGLTLTRPQPGQSWSGVTGRLSAATLQALAPDFRERTVYVCGPDPFMSTIKALLAELGLPMANYFEESFGPPPKIKPAAVPPLAAPPLQPNYGLAGFFPNHPGTSGTPIAAAAGPTPISKSPAAISEAPPPALSNRTLVVFTKAGQEIAASGEDSILEVAEQNGIKIRSSCRAGSCGSCKKLKISGMVRMGDFDPEALAPSELDEGYILTCISFPQGRVVVDA